MQNIRENHTHQRQPGVQVQSSRVGIFSMVWFGCFTKVSKESYFTLWAQFRLYFTVDCRQIVDICGWKRGWVMIGKGIFQDIIFAYNILIILFYCWYLISNLGYYCYVLAEERKKPGRSKFCFIKRSFFLNYRGTLWHYVFR